MMVRQHRRFARSFLWVCAAVLSAAPLAAGGGLAGVEALRDETIRDEPIYELGDEPVVLLLSKSKYPAEDRHLDAIVWLQPPEGEAAEGGLRLSLQGEGGDVLARDVIRPLPGDAAFFSFHFPPGLAGGDASLLVEWVAGGETVGRADGAFSVLPPQNPPAAGRVRLTVPNDGGAVQRGVPVTVGAPFPRGALHDDARVRLVDGAGREVPLQTKVAAKWSRFGSVKWIQCDFVVDADGGPLELFLEYGPNVERAEAGNMEVRVREGRPPLVEAGPVRFGDGVEFETPEGWRRVLAPEALDGAFVEHENGKRFVVPADAEWEIEEQGPEKVLLRRRGWYVHPETGEEFCKFDLRFDIRRGSPVVRIFHSWVFTGYPYEDLYRTHDVEGLTRWRGSVELVEGAGDADRIRNMGWRFALDGLAPEGFLASYEEDPEWLRGDYLLQYDHDQRELSAGGERTEAEGRSAGAASAAGGGARLLLGVKDFWQNFPNELEFADGALYFHQWPRHGRRATHPVRIEDALRLWFAHEGEVLDFALPEEYVTDDVFYYAAPPPAARRRTYSMRGKRQTVNAQGVSKTSEMWLFLADEEVAADESAKVLAGLNDNTLRAVADPRWVAASGAFYEMHPYDPERHPELERTYELHALAPMLWADRIEFYGKWIWGEMTWNPHPEAGTFGLYRGFRQAHQGWPYSWVPFARSGDVRYLRFADAATRHMTDVGFCHYSDERVPGFAMGEHTARPRGFYFRYRIPWANVTVNPSSRGYVDKCNYLWHSYYLTGFPRARDVALDWAHLTKTEGSNNWGAAVDCRRQFRAPLQGDARRGSTTLMQAYVEMYEATFDPWFLAAAHQIARAHLASWREHGWEGHFWNSGPREFHRFTGCDEYAEFYLAYARAWRRMYRMASAGDGGWAWRCGTLESDAYAYLLTGEDEDLASLGFWLDYIRTATYEGDQYRWRGWFSAPGPLFTGYFLQYFPYALGAFERAGRQPGPHAAEGLTNLLRPAGLEGEEGFPANRYRLAIRKEAGEPVPLTLRFNLYQAGRNEAVEYRYRVVGPGGGTVLEGSWNIVGPPAEAEIPAEAPAGTYRLTVEGPGHPKMVQRSGLLLPVSRFGTPEVVELEPGEPVGPSVPITQFWFMVPEGAQGFWAEFSWPPPERLSRGRMPRFTLWDADGRMAWDRQYARTGQPESRTVLAEVEVPPGQSGRLWRLTTASLSQGVALDPAIPRVFSTSRDRWFRPQDDE